MKKRLLKVLSLSLALTMILSIGACAITPRWSLLISITPEISKTYDEYGVTVFADTNVTSINAELILYKKGFLGIYTKKATHTETISAYSGNISGSYDMSTSDEYKLVATVTATTSSGQTETATVEHAV